MASISAYDSSSISTLFSSLNGSSKQGGTDLLGINYSDYASIRSGSYGKLMRSYYSLQSGDDSTKASAVKKTTGLSSDSTKTLANIEDAAQSLTDTARELYTRQNNSVFVKDAKGNYDSDQIYDKVSDFVEDYNSLLSATAKSDTSRIQNALSSMKNMTKVNEDALSAIGISVDSKNGTLSIDKNEFQSADMAKVKSLFNGTGSYGYSVATQASMIDSYAQSEAAKSNTYGQNGKYTYNYNSGNIFQDDF